MDTKVKVKKFLSRFYRKRELLDEENIFELGFTNSLFAMQLVVFIENEFNIQVSNKELDINHFKSVNSIVDLISSKQCSDAIL